MRLVQLPEANAVAAAVGNIKRIPEHKVISLEIEHINSICIRRCNDLALIIGIHSSVKTLDAT
jgi:hypothetical protein